MSEKGDVWIALGLTAFAGMATSIGSAIAFFAKRTNCRFLSVATGFSAGVMLYVSFVEIFVEGTDALAAAYGDHWGHWISVEGMRLSMISMNRCSAVCDRRREVGTPKPSGKF